MSRGPGYLTTGGSPEGSGPPAGSPTGPAPAPSGADALPPSAAGPPAPATGPAAPMATAAGVPAAACLRSCDLRHQYSGAYRATMSRPSRYSPGPWWGSASTIFGEFQPPKKEIT